MNEPPSSGPAPSDPSAAGPDDGWSFGGPDAGAGSPGAGGPDQPGFGAPDDPSAGGSPDGGTGAGPAGPVPGSSGDPASPAEISRRLSGDESRSGRRSRHGTGSALGGAGESGAAGDDTTTTMAPNPIPDAAVVPELPPDFEHSPAPQDGARSDQTLDTLAPLSQAGHTEAKPKTRPALWATAIAFGAVLIVSAAWLWTRRDKFDPA